MTFKPKAKEFSFNPNKEHSLKYIGSVYGVLITMDKPYKYCTVSSTGSVHLHMKKPFVDSIIWNSRSDTTLVGNMGNDVVNWKDSMCEIKSQEIKKLWSK